MLRYSKDDTVVDRSDCRLSVNYRTKSATLNLKGVIDRDTTATLFTKLLDEVENGNCQTVLLNKNGFQDFDIRARNWLMKNFLNSKMEMFTEKLRKISVVNSSGQFDQSAFCTLIFTQILFVKPTFQISKFTNNSKANRWLLAS